MYGYEVNQEIEKRSVRQWANVGLSSIYQTLEQMSAKGLLQTEEQIVSGQGASRRLVYSISDKGREQLIALIRTGLASTEHQRFDYDLSVGVGLTHLPVSEVIPLLRVRREHIQAQFERASQACEYAYHMLGAWAVLDHQRRGLEAELNWLDGLLSRLEKHP